MAFVRDYTPEEYMVSFDVADGDHDLVCTGACEKTSKQSGKQMIEVYFTSPDSAGTYTERFVEGEYFNRNLTKLFDCLGLQRGDFAYTHWVNKRGRGHFEHREETYMDKTGVSKTVNKCIMKYLIVPTSEDNKDFPEDIPSGIPSDWGK